jgi:hypothetical protein
MSLHNLSVSGLATTLFCCAGLIATFPAQAVFFDPPGNQIPSSLSGNSRRGGCAVDEVADAPDVNQAMSERLVAFLPIVPDPSSVVALTTQASTPLWVYVPPTRAQSVEFSLFDNVANNFVYSGRFPIEASGIYQINLPETVELKADESDAPQDYTWFLDLVCEPNNPETNLSHTGTLKRVSPDAVGESFEPQLAQAIDRLDRAKAYGSHGLWLDMVAEVLAEHEASDLADQDENLTQEWRSILEVALPVSEREDVDRDQQLKLLSDADLFIAEMTEISFN